MKEREEKEEEEEEKEREEEKEEKEKKGERMIVREGVCARADAMPGTMIGGRKWELHGVPQPTIPARTHVQPITVEPGRRS